MACRHVHGLMVVLCLACAHFQGSASAAPLIPDFSAAEFDDPLRIDNRYFPLVPGTAYRYSATLTDPDDGETELLEIEDFVTFDTEEVDGVTTRVVRAREWVDGVLEEDTLDWYAQDNDGNVWYMGEDTKELDEEGNVISTEGSWRAGANGARAGFIMPSNPTVGFNYYQEHAPNDEALDQAQVLSLDETVTVPAGTFDEVLKNLETTELEPDAREHKLYAPGVGLILIEEDLNDMGVSLNPIPLQSVTMIPLPPAAWAGLATMAAALLPRGIRALRRHRGLLK
jgi:hypothetical protein